MSKIFQDLKIGIDEDLNEKIRLLMPDFSSYRVIRQSVDARARHRPHFVVSVEVAGPNETLSRKEFQIQRINHFNREKPLIIGTGPAGLFCALRLLEHGIPSVIFERGSKSEKRILSINRFWRYGELDPQNNVCFGEGGAGLYSDGKLITRIKSEHIPYIMRRLVDFGAPAEIEYISNPHVGSDRIRRIIPKIREYLIAHGCEIFFESQVTDLLVDPLSKAIHGLETFTGKKYYSPHVVLATGHSAEDIFHLMKKYDVLMEGKSWAIGLRVEHTQQHINQIQFREFANHPKLGSANYKLVHHDKPTNTGVYSFCMCPGGLILSSGTDTDGVVSNGMSNFSRNSPYANAALVVTLDFEKHFQKENIFAGLQFRKELERSAKQSVKQAGGTKELPSQRLVDFLSGRSGHTLPTSCPSGAKSVRLDELLPKFIVDNLKSGLEKFDHNMKGFIHESAQLFGVETRTSCPLRIVRDPLTLQSLSHPGLYPAGEGAGYAGGITSAACDGVNIADKIFKTCT
jgi:uncharacterized FAD-dependent dehydrogenase